MPSDKSQLELFFLCVHHLFVIAGAILVFPLAVISVSYLFTMSIFFLNTYLFIKILNIFIFVLIYISLIFYGSEWVEMMKGISDEFMKDEIQ